MSPEKSPWIKDVKDVDFDRDVIKASYEKPVVVDFWAPWCAPCRVLGPILEKAISDCQGEVLLAKVNTEENQRLAMDFYIQAIPTVMAFRDGKPVTQFQGALPADMIQEFLKGLQPSEAEKLAEQALGLETDQPAQAEDLYRRAIAADARLDKAQVGLARVLIQLNRDSEAAKILEDATPDGALAEEANRLQGLLDIRKQTQGFGNEDSLRALIANNPKDAQARYQLGCLLAARGLFPEALDMLLTAGELDHQLATEKVRQAMVDVFHLVGDTSTLACEYRKNCQQCSFK